MNRSAPCQSTFRALPQSTSITPFVDKENQQADLTRSSSGKLNLPPPLSTSSFASSSSSSSLKRKSASSTLSPRSSLACKQAPPTLGKPAAGIDGERAATPSEFAVRRAAGTLLELKRPIHGGSNLPFNESDGERVTTPCSAQPTSSPRDEIARPHPPRSLNPVARTLWNGGRENYVGVTCYDPADVDESRSLLPEEPAISRVVSGPRQSPPSGDRRSELMSLAATPPRIDGSVVFRPQPKRLRLATYY